MRFGLVHRIMTDSLAALGVLALVASGQFDRVVNIVFVVCLVVALALKEGWRQRAAQRHLDTIAVFLLIITQVGRSILTQTSPLDLLIEFAVGLQIIRVATRKGAAHDQQVIVLALLHLIAGTVVGGGLGYGLCFFGLLVVTPGALVLSHLRREVEGNYRQGARDRTGLPVDVPRILRSKRVVGRQFIAVTCLLSIPILLFTIALFVVFPRVGLSLLLLNRPKGERMVGFSGKVDLGQVGTLRTDPAIALRVTIPDLPPDPPRRRMMHLRGTALDHYDGRTWSQSTKAHRTIATGGELVTFGAPPDGDASFTTIELEPIDPPVLFFPPTTNGLRLQPGGVGPGAGISMQRGPEGEFRYQAPGDRGIHYRVYQSPDGAVTFSHLRRSERDRYLQLPPDLPPRIGDLAQTWTQGIRTDLARARAIERHLRTDFSYDLASPSGQFDQPLDHFLFESKRGHCEFYSTAMAVMLRGIGVPTRNVTGFVGGTYNKFGKFYAVRQGDAHSWVEAYIEGKGWLTFDPTPPGAAVPQSEVEGALASVRDFLEAVSQRWNRHVLGYDLQQQVSLFDQLSRNSPNTRWARPSGRTLLILGGLLLIAAAVWYLWRQRRRRSREEEGDGHRRSREEVLATSLYQTLDRAMGTMGVTRASATPPLRHALSLMRAGHPHGESILSLTERYLAARFGDDPLDTADRREFDQQVRTMLDAYRATQRRGWPRLGRGVSGDADEIEAPTEVAPTDETPAVDAADHLEDSGEHPIEPAPSDPARDDERSPE